MTATSVSVVVVSRGRPDDLVLCLQALEQQFYTNFEIVVVADSPSMRQISLPDYVKAHAFDEPNVARARNLGIAKAAGEIVAFIDDDAVAEPNWLNHLVAPFAQDEVMASGGYVFGRNGISYQWTGLSVDREGWDHPLDHMDEAPAVFTTERNGRAIRTQGTNMALSRQALVDLGGFDPVFAFFHDDSDLNMRVAQAGGMTAIVPRALVHHRSAASTLRRPDRTPTDLGPIGAGRAAFHRKYLTPGEWARGREELWEAQHRRLCAFLVDGRCEPIDVERLLDSLLNGYDEGLLLDVGEQVTFPDPPPPFARVSRDGSHSHHVLAGGRQDRARLMREAASLRDQGARVSLLILDRTSRFHAVRFADGVWEQSGGVFGKSLRSDRMFVRWVYEDRVARESERIRHLRTNLP